MVTAQAIFVAAGVIFIGVAITGSRQVLQITFPELNRRARWGLGITGGGLCACALLIPTITGQFSNQGTTTSNSNTASPGSVAPSHSAAPVVSQGPKSIGTTTSPSAPVVAINAPKSNSEVSDKGFATSGTTSSLGTDTLWLFDVIGSGYTIDESATVNSDTGKWTASEGNVGPTSPLTIAIVRANQSCNSRLNYLTNHNQYNIQTLPFGCTIATEVTVKVST